MSLSSINFKQDNVRAKTACGVRSKRQESTNLSVGDIYGANPKVFIPKNVNKPQFSNSNHDILGSKPRQLHIGLSNKPETNLSNSDIIGSTPNHVKFKTKRAPHNPLNPEYKL